MAHQPIGPPFNEGSSARIDPDVPTAEGGRSLLDIRTHFGKEESSNDPTRGWRFSHWPECSEATLVWVGPRYFRKLDPHEEPSKLIGSGYKRPADDSKRTRSSSGPRAVVSPEEANLRWRIANGRARSRSRRYFVRNELRYMWVLTFADSVNSRNEVMARVSEFARRLRGDLVADSFPYWYSPELHPKGHGWHVNFFVPMYLTHARVESLWGHGFVWVTDFARSSSAPKGEPLGLCRTPRDGWRRAAQYGCKYAQKDWNQELIGPGVNRYAVAKGFKPLVNKRWLHHLEDGWSAVAELVPWEEWRHLDTWSSNDEPAWDRPPITTFRW